MSRILIKLAQDFLQPTEATYLRVWPSSILSLPSLRALCVLSIIKEKAERERVLPVARSVSSWHGHLPSRISYIHLYLTCRWMHGCSRERERINKARLRVPNLQSDQPIACKLNPFFFFGCWLSRTEWLGLDQLCWTKFGNKHGPYLI